MSPRLFPRRNVFVLSFGRVLLCLSHAFRKSCFEKIESEERGSSGKLNCTHGRNRQAARFEQMSDRLAHVASLAQHFSDFSFFVVLSVLFPFPFRHRNYEAALPLAHMSRI